MPFASTLHLTSPTNAGSSRLQDPFEWLNNPLHHPWSTNHWIQFKHQSTIVEFWYLWLLCGPSSTIHCNPYKITAIPNYIPNHLPRPLGFGRHTSDAATGMGGTITRQSKKRGFNPNNLGSRWKPSESEMLKDGPPIQFAQTPSPQWAVPWPPWYESFGSQDHSYHILSSSRSQRDKEGSAASIPEVAQCCGILFFFLSFVYPQTAGDSNFIQFQHLSYLKRLILLDSKLEHCWALLAFRKWSLMLMILEKILSDLKNSKVQDSPNVDGGLRHEKYWTVTFFGIRVLSRFSLFKNRTNSLLKDIQGIYHSTA